MIERMEPIGTVGLASPACELHFAETLSFAPLCHVVQHLSTVARCSVGVSHTMGSCSLPY